MKLNLSSPYGFKPTVEQLAAIQKYDPSAAVHPDDYQFEYDRGRLKGYVRADPSLIVREPALCGVEWSIRADDMSSSVYNDILFQLEAINLKLNRYTAPDVDAGAAPQFNSKCSVHVPNLGLLLIDEVKVIESCCTDMLQEELEHGWRILAICPQPDQRRPDYVLGKAFKS